MGLLDTNWYVDFGDGSTTGYYAVAQWAAGATIAAGAMRRQLAAPAVGSERVFICTVGGTTGGAEPTWVITRGAKTTDNTVTWQEVSGNAPVNGDLANTAGWAAVKAASAIIGQIIKRANGASYWIAGNSAAPGASEPSWANDTAGTTQVDGSVTWTCLGVVGNFTGWQAPHARLNNAFGTNWAAAGNKIFVASEHAETSSAAITNTAPGTAPLPTYIVCVNKSNVPPTSANETTGATISTTGANNISNTCVANGLNYCQGITFSAGSGANTASLFPCVQSWKYKNCALQLAATVGGAINTGATPSKFVFKLDNCTMQFGSTAQNIVGVCDLEWRGGSITGATFPTGLIAMTAASCNIEGVDLSALSTGKTIVPAPSSNNSVKVQLKDCKLDASVTVAAVSTVPNVSTVDVIRSDSAAHNYRTERYKVEGTQTPETTIVRTGGASDGTTPIAWKLVTTANVSFALPFEPFPISIWNDVTAANVTVTVFGIWGGGAVPNNDDIWMEVEYPGSSSTPLGSFVTTGNATVLASNAANGTDGSTWGGSTTAFKMVAVLSAPQPGMKGPITVRIKAAKASTTFYIDPKVVLS